MDVKSAGSPEEEAPPIPARHRFRVSHPDPSHHHHHHHHRHPLRHHARRSRQRSPPAANCASIPPASPEIISNLITSLSVISQPANSHFELQPASLPIRLPNPTSPSPGSFGVDYGAYARSGPQDSTTLAPTSLDDLAASPPVIRTCRPTSGFSPLTGAKSPKTRSSSRDSGGSGFRNLIRSSSCITSCPSSPDSAAAAAAAAPKNSDTHNLASLSKERGAAESNAKLHPCRSHDSWGKKAGRSTKPIMYMSSKERLRERELERKRLSSAQADGGCAVEAGVGTSGTIEDHGRELDPALAETAISEEPASHDDTSGVDGKDLHGSHRPIPARDSSLRKARTRQKPSNDRCSERDGKMAVDGAVSDAEEQVRRERNVAAAARYQHTRRNSDTQAHETSFPLSPDEFLAPPVSGPRTTPSPAMDTMNVDSTVHSDEGATPFLATLGLKRSSPRLKPLPGQSSPRSESRTSMAVPPDSSSQSQTVYPAGYERPASADSIDDAVESYLCSPRLSQRIRHPQTGRVISFSEVGDAAGSAVFCCVGMGLTRYITGFYDELASTLKLRLITPDRPGVGGSEPYADDSTSPLSWPDDVYAICQALKITKFSILAHSAGAIYALATALRMPQHIRGRIHLLAPWIPPSQMNVFGGSQSLPPTNAIPTSQKILRHLPTTFLKAANSSFMTATSSSITSSLPKNTRRTKRRPNAHGKDGTHTGSRNVTTQDNEPSGNNKNDGNEGHPGHPDMKSPNMSEDMDQVQPVHGTGIDGHSATKSSTGVMADRERQMTYETRLTHAIWELATTGANPAVDLLVCLERRHTIGFRYVDITRPVVIHHGSRDSRVPVENVKWLGKSMRRCEVRVLEGEGHGLMASATVMGSLLMEMSKEWEDWMRATGADGRKDRERGRRGTISSAA
ncbi:hypothetical protein E4U42_005642 [Claviceps africana]|uniref:AB hydrolase-1 domain-containing protein n=1 Tax=Claviceps africana TaxID=83212 RepID=A0A8K0J4D7_9HYPO|nr:hypothetical protein E4U42_005642 [Claviceps africana]